MEAALLIDPCPVRPASAGTRKGVMRGSRGTRGSGQRRHTRPHHLRSRWQGRPTGGPARQTELARGGWGGGSYRLACNSGWWPAHSVGLGCSSRAGWFREAATACFSDFQPSQKKRRWISPTPQNERSKPVNPVNQQVNFGRNCRTHQCRPSCAPWGRSPNNSPL